MDPTRGVPAPPVNGVIHYHDELSETFVFPGTYTPPLSVTVQDDEEDEEEERMTADQLIEQIADLMIATPGMRVCPVHVSRSDAEGLRRRIENRVAVKLAAQAKKEREAGTGPKPEAFFVLPASYALPSPVEVQEEGTTSDEQADRIAKPGMRIESVKCSVRAAGGERVETMTCSVVDGVQDLDDLPELSADELPDITGDESSTDKDMTKFEFLQMSKSAMANHIALLLQSQPGTRVEMVTDRFASSSFFDRVKTELDTMGAEYTITETTTSTEQPSEEEKQPSVVFQLAENIHALLAQSPEEVTRDMEMLNYFQLAFLNVMLNAPLDRDAITAALLEKIDLAKNPVAAEETK
jgi:hypothetical protein